MRFITCPIMCHAKKTKSNLWEIEWKRIANRNWIWLRTIQLQIVQDLQKRKQKRRLKSDQNLSGFIITSHCYLVSGLTDMNFYRHLAFSIPEIKKEWNKKSQEIAEKSFRNKIKCKNKKTKSSELLRGMCSHHRRPLVRGRLWHRKDLHHSFSNKPKQPIEENIKLKHGGRTIKKEQGNPRAREFGGKWNLKWWMKDRKRAIYRPNAPLPIWNPNSFSILNIFNNINFSPSFFNLFHLGPQLLISLHIYHIG